MGRYTKTFNTHSHLHILTCMEPLTDEFTSGHGAQHGPVNTKGALRVDG